MDATGGIQVLMMGGRRTGKTSMLAGLFEVMLGEDIQKLVTVEDTTQGNNVSLAGKVKELKELLIQRANKVIMDDKLGTDKFHPYSLKFSIPGTGHSTHISFTDANGEYYTQSATYAQERQELEKRVKESDIILIAIDAVYLMEESAAQNELANCVTSVEGLLTNLRMEECAKMVVYVPIKCEKWAGAGHRLEEVTNRIEQVYANSIKALSASPLVEIIVLPVQTVGNMVFHEFLPAYLYNNNGSSLPCSIIDGDSALRFADGRTKLLMLEDAACLVEDSKAVFLGTTIKRPNSWFRVISSRYEPSNCEQLAYHILRYMLYRSIDAIEVRNSQRRHNGRGWWKWALAIAAIVTGTFWLYAAAAAAFLWGSKLGDISTSELEALVNRLSAGGFIKDSRDGIKIVRPYQRIIKN